MRLIFSTILIFTFAATVSAQSLQIVETPASYNVKIGEEVSTTIKIKNLSAEPVNILVRRNNEKLGSSQETYFCWGGDCKEKDADVTYVSQVIQPGQILETFTSVLETGLDETSSAVTYTFYNRDDPSDFVEFNLNYEVKEQVSRGNLYTSEAITMSDIYPNPVSDVAYMDYVATNEELEAKVVLHNILGSIVSEYKLNPRERELKIFTSDLKPGVYFYTVYVDSEGKVTKKLVIKR